MKPVHVVVLLFAGALGGALLMKVVSPAKPPVHTAAATRPVRPVQLPAATPAALPPVEAVPEPVAQTPSAEPEPAPAVGPIVAPIVKAPAKPSPMPPPVRQPVQREAPQPVQVRLVASVPIAPVAPPAQPSVQDPAPVPAPAPPPTIPTIAPPPAEPEPVQATVPADPAPPQPHQVTLNAGYLLPVRLVDGLSSERNAPGDVFQATLDRELVADGFVIAERGQRVEGRVVAVDRSKAGSAAALAVELTHLHTSDGQTVPIQTESYFKHAGPGQMNNTTKIAGGAIIGAAIGAIAGGGKGAAIGAGIGGGAGAGDVLLTHRPAELPTETLVTFKMKGSVQLTERQ